MKELEEIYNRLYDEYIDARRKHFESARDMKKNGDRIYLHGKVHGLEIAINIVDEVLNGVEAEYINESSDVDPYKT
nr:MAG TPA: hypothetical protein [Bacteriophage sp.]